MRGEWIEIRRKHDGGTGAESLPMRGEWIEIHCRGRPDTLHCRSLPMRGEWIEIDTAA